MQLFLLFLTFIGSFLIGASADDFGLSFPQSILVFLSYVLLIGIVGLSVDYYRYRNRGQHG